MAYLLLALVTSFFLVLVSTPALIKVALLKRLVDEPDDQRKLHARRIPTIGGIIIFAATIFSYALWFPTHSFFDVSTSASLLNEFKYLAEVQQAERSINDFKFILSAVIVMFFVGVKDDIIGTAAIKKLVAHFIVAMMLVLMADVRIRTMHGIFGVEVLPEWASIFLSVFTIIVIVNAFNLIDGVDGLASGIGLIAGIFLGLWFYFAGEHVLSVLAFSLSGSLIGFLIFNFNPAKIFMGDSGSLVIGLIISVLAIRLLEFNHIEKISSVEVSSVSRPIFVMSVLAYPLIDTLRVFTIRLFKGISPFSADRNHIHHCLQDIGFGHKGTALTIFAANIVIVGIAIAVRELPSNFSFVILSIFTLLLSQTPYWIKNIKRKKQAKSSKVIRYFAENEA